MEDKSTVHDRPFHIPRIAWIVGIGLLIVLTAVFVFNISPKVVANYGLLVLMFGGHFLMHRGHGNHDHGSNSGTVDSKNDAHSNHTPGCH